MRYFNMVIAFVSGEVYERGSDWVVVAAAGLGYRIETTSRVAASCHQGEHVLLHTQLVVREDAHTLYGFFAPTELEMFNVLLGVNGVGPRSALGVLSALTPAEIVRAVAAEDAKPFQQVSGIGPKSAKMIVVSLAGKLERFRLADGETAAAAAQSESDVVSENSYFEQVLVALTGLGWQEKEAAVAVQDAANTGADQSAAQLLRAALKLLQSR